MTEKTISGRGYRRTRFGAKTPSGQIVTHLVTTPQHSLRTGATHQSAAAPDLLGRVTYYGIGTTLTAQQVDFAPVKRPVRTARLLEGSVSRDFNGRANVKFLRRSLQQQQGLMLEHQTVIWQQQEQLDLMACKIADLEAKIQLNPLLQAIEMAPAAVRPRGSDPVALTELVLRASTWLSAQAVSARAGMRNKNASSTPNKWKNNGAIFAINYQGQDHYPAFALGIDGKPLSIMKDILTVFNGHKVPLAIGLWFVSANSWLDGATPQDVVGTRPGEVLEAAKMEVAPIEHG